MPLSGKQMGLEIVMLSEISQPHKDKYPLFSFMGNTLLGVDGDKGMIRMGK